MGWRAKIEEQQSSGQEPSAFCRQRNICSSGFYAWRKRLGLKESPKKPVVKSPRMLSRPLKSLPGVGFLRLDEQQENAAVLRNPVNEQPSRVMWIETPGGYRVALNGGVGLAEVFSLLRSL